MTSRSVVRYLFIAVVLALLVTLPVWVENSYVFHLLTVFCINATLAASLNIMIKGGSLSFGHAAYVGVGAYASALLVTRLGLSWWLAFPAAGLTAAVLAYFIGSLTLGLRGIYFSLTTFGLTEVLRGIYIAYPDAFGGPRGIANIPPPAGIETPVAFYYLALAFFLVAIFILYSLSKSMFGLLCDGVNSNYLLEEHVGLDTKRLRITVFVIGCTFAGLAGSIFAHFLSSIGPDQFSTGLSIDVLVFAALGGIGSIGGAVIGAGVLTFVGDFLYQFGAWKSFVFGAVLIVIVLFVPNGIVRLPWRRMVKPMMKSAEEPRVGGSRAT